MLHPRSSPRPPPRRVAITGAGILTALGNGWAANAEGFRSGRVAIRPVTLFDVSRQRVRVAGGIDLPPEEGCGARRTPRGERCDRASRFLQMAAREAWDQAGWDAGAEDLPLVLGTTSGGMTLGEAYYRQAITPPHSRRSQPTRSLHYQAQRQALDLEDVLKFSGPVTIIANACASGGNAIGHAADLIRTGRATRVLGGGYDGLSQLVFAGFDSLQALSPTRCRPFEATRDGLALGEGAAMLALEDLDRAKARGATILAEVSGYGAATDVHHLTQPHPEGTAAFASMDAACRAAGVTAAEIGYVNAHGTGTPLNDAAETAAINAWAGAAAGRLPVSSTKSGVGHLLGAAGAVEAVICLMVLRERFLPPTSTTTEVDPACRFPVITRPTEARVDWVLSNSFGFGGANASLVFRRFE